MAAYHFTAKIVARGGGLRSVVRSAAYRAAERLFDDRLGETVDYTRKRDVIAKAIFAPDDAPAWVHDRQQLWNRVEARENRKDAQLAQEFELNLPREFSDRENWRLVTDFVKAELVAKGRIADVAMHRHEAGDGESHPHAHILMPLRVLDGDRFGGKHPDIDRKTFFQNRNRITELREIWCAFAATRAAELGIDLGPDWDHRSLEARDLDIEPQPKIGATAARLAEQKRAAERVAEFQETLERNGERLLANPTIATKALTTRASTFTANDLARWIHRHSTEDQFADILTKAKAQLVPVGIDRNGVERFSTAEMIALERGMMDDALALARTGGHPAEKKAFSAILSRSPLSAEQQEAARHTLEGGDLTALVGLAGAGKSTMLASVREAFSAAGYTVKGGALSGIAAQNLEQGSGIEGRTLASWAYAWGKGRDQLTARDVLVIDEAGMIGSRQLADVLRTARQAGAKVVLVGDAEQLQAIEAGAAFRAISERIGAAELSTVHRQHDEWQRTATRELATGETGQALARYHDAGAITAADTVVDARTALVRKWLWDQLAEPDASQLILAHTRADVQAINDEVRDLLKRLGKIGAEVEIDTARGTRAFGAGDRLLFLKNDRDLGVKNGTLGWIEKAESGELVVRTDDGRRVTFDPTVYQDLDHGYAVTVHKSQGVTVDRSYVLATGGFDRHLAYVALSRHRAETTLVYSREDFGNMAGLAATLSRERAKDTTLDYAKELREARGFAPLPEAVRPAPQPEPDRDKDRDRDRDYWPDLSR